MKSFFKTLSIALLSAVCSIYVYDQFFQTGKPTGHATETPRLIPTNYTFNTNGYAAESTDFTSAAEKTVNAVVHVKNTSTSDDNLPSFYQYFYGDEDLPERIGTGSGVGSIWRSLGTILATFFCNQVGHRCTQRDLGRSRVDFY